MEKEIIECRECRIRMYKPEFPPGYPNKEEREKYCSLDCYQQTHPDMTSPLTKRIEKILRRFMGDENTLEDSVQALTTLFEEELEALAGEVEKLEKKMPTNELRDVAMALRDPKTLSKEDLERQEARDYRLKLLHIECAVHNAALFDVLALIRSKATRI